MSHIHQVHNDRGEVLAEIVTIQYAYALPAGRHMPLPADVAWCHTCHQFTYAESVTTVPDVDRHVEGHIAYLRRREGDAAPADDDKSARRAALRAQLKQKILSSYAALRECLAARDTPPRCLECGGTSFVPIPKGGEWANHPAQPGTKVRVHNFGQIQWRPPRHLYSPQTGLRINAPQSH